MSATVSATVSAGAPGALGTLPPRGGLVPLADGRAVRVRPWTLRMQLLWEAAATAGDDSAAAAPHIAELVTRMTDGAISAEAALDLASPEVSALIGAAKQAEAALLEHLGNAAGPAPRPPAPAPAPAPSRRRSRSTTR